MISVCIATYNGAKYIGEQLSSILPQLDGSDEVIISDDGSTDGTTDIIATFTDSRIRVIDGAHRGVPVWNFEKAISEAKGDYIFLSDQDDIWADNKVAVTMHYLRDYDCVISDCIVTDESMNAISPSFYTHNRSKPGRFYNLLVRNGYLGCCMAFTRRVRSAALPFPANIPMHDIWIGNMSAFYFRTKFIDTPLIYYRRHNGNFTQDSGQSPNSLITKLTNRLTVIADLCRMCRRKTSR